MHQKFLGKLIFYLLDMNMQTSLYHYDFYNIPQLIYQSIRYT